MLNKPNTDSYSATPVGLQSPFPTSAWSSNTFDVLRLFAFPIDNQAEYKFATSTQNSKVGFNHILHSRARDNTPKLRTQYKFRSQQVLQFYLLAKEVLVWAKCSTQQIKLQLIPKNFIKASRLFPKYFFEQENYQEGWKFYGSYSATRQFRNPSFKIGALWSDRFAKNYVDFRYRFNQEEFNNQRYVYCKSGYTWNEIWNIGGIIVLNVNQRILQKNDVKVGWEIDKFSWASLQLQTDGFRSLKKSNRSSSWFDVLRANYIRQRDDKWTGGLTLECNLQQIKFKKAQAVINYTAYGLGLSNFRAKVNNNLQIALAGKYSHSSTFKAEIGLLFDKSFLSNFKPVRFGANITIGQQ